MYDKYDITKQVLKQMLLSMPRDIALCKVYDYHENEELCTTDYYIDRIISDDNAYNFNDVEDVFVYTSISFATREYFKEYYKMFCLLDDKQQKKLNKLSKKVFTIDKEDTGHFTTMSWHVNKKVNINVIKETCKQVVTK